MIVFFIKYLYKQIFKVFNQKLYYIFLIFIINIIYNSLFFIRYYVINNPVVKCLNFL